MAAVLVLGPGAPPAAAAVSSDPVVLSDATPGGTQASSVLAGDGSALLVAQGVRRLVVEGGTSTEVVPPASLSLPFADTVQVNGLSVLRTHGRYFAWYDGAGHGTDGFLSSGALLGPVPGGYLRAVYVLLAGGGAVTRVQRVDGVTGALTTVRDLDDPALSDQVLGAAVLRDRVVLLTRRSGAAALVVVPLSGATPTVLGTDDTSSSLSGLVASAAGYAWRNDTGVHARLSSGAQLQWSSSPSSYAVSSRGLSLTSGQGLTTVDRYGTATTTPGSFGALSSLGSQLVTHLAAGQLGAALPGLHTVPATGAPVLVRPDDAAPLAARRVVVGSHDVLWTDNAEGGLYGVRAKALGDLVAAPVRTVSSTSDQPAAQTTVASASGDDALVSRSSSVQLLARQPDGSWPAGAAAVAGRAVAQVTPGWLSNGLGSITRRTDGQVRSLGDSSTPPAVSGDQAWAPVVQDGGRLLGRLDLSTGRTTSTALSRLASLSPQAAGDLVAVAVSEGGGYVTPAAYSTTLLRRQADDSVTVVASGLPGRPVAMTERLLVTSRYDGRELLARDLATGAVTLLADPYGIAPQSVSATDGAVGWVGGDGRPRLAQVLPATSSVRYGGGAGPNAVPSGTAWQGTWPLTAPLTSCALSVDSAAGPVRTLACTPSGSTATASWDGTDSGGQPVPDGFYRWTLTGTGPAGDLPPTSSYLRVTGSAAPGVPLSVTLSPTGPAAQGVVRTSWPGLDCTSGTCPASFPAGSSLTLTAEVRPGGSAGPWSGACTSDPCTVTLDAPRAVTKTLLDDVPTVLDTTGFGYVGNDPVLAYVRFSEPVTGARAGLRLRDAATGSLVPGTWSCLSGPADCDQGQFFSFHARDRQPANNPYRVEVSDAVVDSAGQPAGPWTSAVVRGSNSVQFRDADASWARTSSTLALGGTYLHESGPGATWRTTFTGTGQRLWFLRGPSGGRASLLVDGRSVAVLDQYAATPARGSYDVRWLRPGPHVLQLRVLGTHSSRSSGDDVTVDGLSGLTTTCTPTSTAGCVVSPAGTMTLGLVTDGGWAGQGYRTTTRWSGVTWRFYGSTFTAYGQGYVQVRVDGGAPVSASLSYQGLTVKGLTRAPHTVQLLEVAPRGFAELADFLYLTATD